MAQDPKHVGQEPPGHTAEMTPKPNYGEQSYKGCGKLEGRAAIITGGDFGIEWSGRHGEQPKGAGMKLECGRLIETCRREQSRCRSERSYARRIPHRIGQTAAGTDRRRDNPSAGLDKPGGHEPEAC